MNTRWTSLRRVFDNFRKDSGGNVALMFAIAAVPIVGMVGAAVDFSHANSVKAAMQTALDSTALLLSKNASGLTNDQLQTAAKNYFNAMFNRPEAKNIQISATYTTSGGAALSVSGSATVPTTFMGVLGYNEIPVTDKATTKWGSSRLRVALVLDNTGSMDSDGKIARAQDRDQEAADPIARGRIGRWRRLCLDRSVRQGREDRHDRLQFVLGQLDHVGRRHRQLVGRHLRQLQHGQQIAAQFLRRTGVLLAVWLQQPEQLHWRRHMHDLEQNHAKHLHRGRHLFDFEQNEPKHLHERGRLLESCKNDPEHLHDLECLHLVGLHNEQPMHVAWRSLG